MIVAFPWGTKAVSSKAWSFATMEHRKQATAEGLMVP